MKRQVRLGVFETNSSSVHSLTVCTAQEFSDWEDGKLLFYDHWNDNCRKFYSSEEEAKADNPNYVDYLLVTRDQFYDRHEQEHYVDTKKLTSGETIVCFGYSGFDG